MKSRKLHRLRSLPLLALALLAPARLHAAAPPPPNIVLILSDDLGYADLGVHGCKDIPTPNLDRLAREGVRFTNGYVCSAICAPSRAGLLSGRHPVRLGITGNHEALPRTETTLAQFLNRSGYATGMLGKWHLGAAPAEHPLKRGFDEFFGFLGHSNNYLQPEGYYTDTLTDKAVDFISRHKTDRFFLYLAYNATHAPMQATRKYTDRFPGITDPARKTYAGMLGALDDGVGRVLQTLDTHGLADNTLVIFLNDNGGKIDDPGSKRYRDEGSRNTPLRKGKYWLYDGGVRVPFFIRWPAALKGGRTYEPLVSSLDVLPTLVAAARGALDPKQTYDGVDLLPFLAGEKQGAPHTELVWRALSDRVESRKPWTAIRRDQWKLHVFQDNGAEAVELFDVAADPGESRNLAADHPELVRQLRAALAASIVSRQPVSVHAAERDPE